MFFRKKKPVPIEEIQSLQSRGLDEKEIIKELKSRGYSYGDIEKAMLQTVKAGIGPSSSSDAPRFEDVYSREESILPELESAEVELPEQPISPETVVEEIVEGIVEEKWEKLEKRLADMEYRISGVKAEIKSQKPVIPASEVSHEYDARLNELSDQVEELQARIGGLEKAFKQFLPALTSNIESLSKLIHEMKMKQGIQIEE